MADLDPDRVLALSYVGVRHKPALRALWSLDAALGAVLGQGREPMISRIKLAWWRDALEALDRGKAPAEPVLASLAEQVLPLVSGAELAGMEEGWAVLLSPDPLSAQDLATYAEGRGGLLFRFAGRLLGGPEEAAATDGAAWALADLARHSGNEGDADAALGAIGPSRGARLPSRLRPLGMLGALARRDAEPKRARWEAQGSPGRMLRLLRYRLTGR